MVATRIPVASVPVSEYFLREMGSGDVMRCRRCRQSVDIALARDAWDIIHRLTEHVEAHRRSDELVAQHALNRVPELDFAVEGWPEEDDVP